MKEYMVKVTEKHCDYVWVKANSEYEATRKAPRLAKCKFDLLHDSVVVEERDIQNKYELSCGGDPVPAYKPRTKRNDQLNKEHNP